MTLFDLLLILLVFVTAIAVVVAIVALFFRRWGVVGRLFAGVIVVWGVYLGVGTVVALRAPQHIMRLGEDRCFDEMCFAVTGWTRVPSSNVGRSYYLVTVRITNRSRGRAQRELGRKGVLIDRSGRVYEISPEGMHGNSLVGGPPFPGLDAEVGPGQSLVTTQVFDLPTDVEYPGFALGSNLAINPARIVLGDEDHFLHWPTVWPLD
ncbi:MAG: hypothetical protein ABSG96_17345 [Terracidiphilus sp.]